MFLCKSRKHQWVSPVNAVNAARCCNPKWRRVNVPESEQNTLDINGRIYDENSCTVSGWIEVNDAK